MPTSPSSSFSKRARSYSRPQTPTSSTIHSRYGSSPARSSKPKVLPFPDLPLRGSGSGVSRDASRATSPAPTPPLLSPRGSQSFNVSPGASGSAIGLSSLGLEASGSGGGGSGYFGSSEEVGVAPNSGYTSASGTGHNTPSGATTPRSPLGRPSLRQPAAHPPSSFTAYIAGDTSSATSTGSRSRSQTTANIMQQPRTNHSVSPPSIPANSFPPATSASPSPRSILLNPLVSSANPTTRIEGFHPIPVSPTATIRPASVPTSATTSAAINTPLPAASSSSTLANPLPSLPNTKDASSSSSKKIPPNQVTTPVSAQAAALTPAMMPDAFEDHLYSSFLKGTCADVRIYVRKWGVGWAVHRMVLVQASSFCSLSHYRCQRLWLIPGFFHSMFLGGFAETRASRLKGKGKGMAIFSGDDDWTGENVELQFDDPNITRAAFE